MIKNVYKTSIKKIRTDHGREFENSLFTNFCDKTGIFHEFSAPKTPQQNGVAERKNRTIQEMGRFMLNSMNVAKKFWSEAFNTACHVINRVYLRPGTTMTPYEILKGKKPNMSYFHVFGCTCYIPNDRDYLKKLDSKSDNGIFLGYSNNSHAYRVYNLRLKTIQESVNVAFNDYLSVSDKSEETGSWDFVYLPATEDITVEVDPTPATNVDSTPVTEEPSISTEGAPSNSETTGEGVTDQEKEIQTAETPETPVQDRVVETSTDVASTPVGDDDPSDDELDNTQPLYGKGRRNAGKRVDYRDLAGMKSKVAIVKYNSNLALACQCLLDKSNLVQVRASCFVSIIEPKNYKEALLDNNWIDAMQDELNQFEKNQVWTLVPRPPSVNVIGTKWIFKNKTDDSGTIVRNKARLVAQGYTQVEGVDFDETFAPVARIESIRLLLSIACYLNITLQQMDVKGAFLNGIIDKEAYVEQPKGFEDPFYPNHVYKLQKALYGLKQAPRAWYDKLTQFLLEFGFLPWCR